MASATTQTNQTIADPHANELERHLEAPGHPIWIVGAPGIGKTYRTRAALERVPHRWCDLRGCNDRGTLIDRLVATLELGSVQDLTARLDSALENMAEGWIVCDDASECTPDLVALLEQLRPGARARFVVTSQHKPRARRVLIFGPVSAEAAAEIFTLHARRALPAWELDADDDIGALLRRLGGSPLAITLAASHIPLMSAAQMCASLDEARGPFDDALGASMALSWGALTQPARALLMCCSIMNEPMSLACIRALCSGILTDDLNQTMLSLLDRSLLDVMTRGGQRAFDMLSTTRRFARMKLEEDPRLKDKVLSRLVDWVKDCLSTWRARARTPRGLAVTREHASATRSITLAIERARGMGRRADALEIALAHIELSTHTVITRAIELLEASRGDWRDDVVLETRFHVQLATLWIKQGRLELAREELDACELAEDAAPELETRFALVESLLERDRGHVDQARAILTRRIEELGDDRCPVDELELRTALGLLQLNAIRFGQRAPDVDIGVATRHITQALALSHHTNLKISAATRDAHALSLHERGRTRQGQVLLEELVSELEAASLEEQLVPALSHASALAYFAADFETARAIAEKSSRLCLRRGHNARHARQMSSDGVFALAAGALDDAERVLLLAQERCHRHGQSVSELVAISQLAMLYAELGDQREASSWVRQGVALATSIDAHGHHGLLLLWGAVVDDTLEDKERIEHIERAAQQLSRALEYQTPEGDPRWMVMRRLFEERAALARAERWLRARQPDRARAVIEQSRGAALEILARRDPLLLVAARQLLAVTDDLIERYTIPRGHDYTHTLIVARDGAWFELDGARVSLASRETLRRLFVALIDRWRPAPESPEKLDVEALVEIGWPGELLEHQSAINRVYASIRLLRKLGLKEVLLTHDGGYLIADAVHVVITED